MSRSRRFVAAIGWALLIAGAARVLALAADGPLIQENCPSLCATFGAWLADFFWGCEC